MKKWEWLWIAFVVTAVGWVLLDMRAALSDGRAGATDAGGA